MRRPGGSALRFTILDRYMLAELAGPFLFGLSAFVLIFAAAQILAIGRLVSDAHAPLFAAIEVFLWQLPYIVVEVFPMAMLLGTLLAMQRLSGESEITAMKAGGITFLRIIAPLLAAGFVLSLVTLVLQEGVVPFANDRVTAIQDTVINHISAFGRDLTVRAPLPNNAGFQETIAQGFEQHSQALLHVTIVQYDERSHPTRVLFADRAQFTADRWTLDNVSAYAFAPDGSVTVEPNTPQLQVDIGEKPTDLLKRVAGNNPDNMSRSTIADIIRSGQLTPSEYKKYVTTYWQKLAQPFACFVFVLIAVPFGIRSVRGGGNTSIGFGLAVLIVFIYYVVLTIFSYVGEALVPIAALVAWMPNIIFTAIGLRRLQMAASV
ncbi:MAG TPA: LptF/LptG family permease [Candidatus Baltobacteraceae bacterium]